MTAAAKELRPKVNKALDAAALSICWKKRDMNVRCDEPCPPCRAVAYAAVEAYLEKMGE